MLLTLLVLLVVLWFLGYLHIPSFTLPDVALFTVNGHVVTLVETLIFLVIMTAVGVLPTPLRQVGFALALVWVLSTLGVLAIPGLASILVIAIIVGLIAAVLGAAGGGTRTVVD
ncbi:MAG TPA: hypothetical protein VGQ62_22440 [Chloroflexota bacterium]|jgi:hypothetical protein|nr:hypothetical protein [Chloroflexota bacterium]